MGSYVLTTVLVFSLLGCGLAWTRPLDFPGSRRGGDYPGKHGFEHPRKDRFDYPVKREPEPTVDVDIPEEHHAEEDELTTTLQENPVVCEVCKFVVADLQSLLGNDSSKIIAFLDSICADLPAEVAATCKQYVDGWTPYIIDFLENSTPEEICTDLTLCTAAVQSEMERRLGLNPFGHVVRLFREVFTSTKVDKILMRHALGNEYLCQGCDDLVKAIYTQLIDDHVLDEVTTLLKEVCSLTPVVEDCDEFVEKTSAEIKALVEQYLNNETCTKIGLCPGFEVDPLEPVRGFLGKILPDGFDRFRPRPRPRPDTEPAPRGHPFREHDRNNSRGGPRPGHHDHHGHSYHSGERHNHTSSKPQRPHVPLFRPFGRDHPHHGHGPVSRPLPHPHFTSWWSLGGLRPFWPRRWDIPMRPTSPLDPMSTTPEPNTVPQTEPPRPTLPFVPVPKRGKIDPRKPQFPKKQFIPRLPEDIPVPRVDIGVAVPNVENHRPSFPGKHQLGERKHGERKGNRRRQRSVVINSINIGDLEEGYPYDIESNHESEMQSSWQCDTCEYGVDAVQNVLLERAGTFQEKLMRVANGICHRLPAATVAECKTEVANVLNGLVDKVINDYVTPDQICPLLKLC